MITEEYNKQQASDGYYDTLDNKTLNEPSFVRKKLDGKIKSE
jgi:hypothetical protein